MVIVDWYEVTAQALSGLWQGFAVFVPKLIGAVVIILIGWLISVLVGKIIAEVFRKVQFNKIFEKGAWKTALEKAEFKVDASGFIGVIFKWVLVIVFLSAAVEVLGLPQFAAFLYGVLNYLPKVIVAVLIFVVAVIISDILEKVVRAATEGAKVGYGQLIGAIVKWSIWVFAFFVILDQLLVEKAIIITLMQGIVGVVVLAGGIAFGLGGKDAAADFIQDVKRKVKE